MKRTKFPKPFVITDVEGVPIIRQPAPGTIVTHTGWHPGPGILKGYPCDVYIVGGQYEVNGRISNSFYWRRVLKDSKGNITLGKTISGYGSFHECKTKYNIKVQVK